MAASYDPRRQTLKARVARSGADLRSRLARELDEATHRGALVAHVDLPLSHPATPSAAQDIRSLGFFFAGLLPEYRDGDVLRMQWVSDSVSVGEADAITASSTRSIEAFVLEDRP